VLITDTPSRSKKYRENLADMMFRRFRVPSLAIFNSSVLSLFSTGKTRGVVLEMGEGSCHAVPVFEGYALPHATSRLNLAGTDIDQMGGRG
jgi:actin-related protein